MKRNRLLITIFGTALSLILYSTAFSQKYPLPAGLTDNSSLNEVLDWLNKTSFDKARIGLDTEGPSYGEDHVTTDTDTYAEWAVFSQGFKLDSIDRCTLVLKNADVELLSFSTKYPDPKKGSLSDFRANTDDQSKFTGELFVPLQLIKAHKRPYRHTKKPEKAELLGVWRTEFKTKSFVFLLIPSISKVNKLLEHLLELKISGNGQNDLKDRMRGDKLTFTFDDKETSENFNSAFRRAIELCKE